MLKIEHIITIFSITITELVHCVMEPNVVGGVHASINNFPHSTFLSVRCKEGLMFKAPWICGASIINDRILLTAGHCLDDCPKGSQITGYVGSAIKRKGKAYGVDSYLLHENYNSFNTVNDIGLVKLENGIIYSENAKRVAIMKSPPYSEIAYVAGWGMTNEITETMEPYLKYIPQYVWKIDTCKQMIQKLPKGVICASSGNINRYSSRVTKFIDCEMEPFVVGGTHAYINQFPHSTFLNVNCKEGDSFKSPWICGASIINDRIILTAAHCLDNCGRGSIITAYVGSATKRKGKAHTAYSYLLHDRYDSFSTVNDIGLVKLTHPIQFSQDVKRVAIMKSPPYNEVAHIAGWGMTNEYTHKMEPNLKYTVQYVWKNKACKQLIRKLPKGAICASSGDTESYSSRGDSGSALVVRGYIQIGIVSYKVPKVSRDLVIYTDTGYFYDWITTNSKRLYCA